MEVHYDITQLPAFNKAVITIGTFDGLHNGHRQLIYLMQKVASEVGGETVIITFDPHPRQVVAKDRPPVYLLNTLAEKINLLEATGIHHLVVVPFTEAFSSQSANDYISNFLVNTFHPHTIIIGYDHRFGKDRTGDYRLLEANSQRWGYAVQEIPGYMLQQITVSSTRIREALLNGAITDANELLGYPYFFSGLVVEGNRLGRTIGYPTANLRIEGDQKLIPANGVYAVTVAGALPDHQSLGGMMNIGVRPTVDGVNRTIEVNLFDFDADIYGKVLQIKVHQLMRKEVKFNGLDALKAQLALDKIDAQTYLKTL